MAEWGRKEYSKKWPSRTPVWTWTAILLTFLFFAGMLSTEDYAPSRGHLGAYAAAIGTWIAGCAAALLWLSRIASGH